MYIFSCKKFMLFGMINLYMKVYLVTGVIMRRFDCL